MSTQLLAPQPLRLQRHRQMRPVWSARRNLSNPLGARGAVCMAGKGGGSFGGGGNQLEAYRPPSEVSSCLATTLGLPLPPHLLP